MEPVKYPRALVEGSRIVVTAPSAGVAEPLWPRLDLVITYLRQQGFVVEEGRCLRGQRKDASASATERAADLMSAFLRDDVDAVFPPWGGELAIELLELMDFQVLAATRPKWLLGFSDLSTLMLPLRLLAGWASAHGPNLMDLSPTQSDELTASALAPLQAAPGARVEQRASTLRRGKEWIDFAVDPRAAHILTEPTRWWALGGDLRVKVSGRVLGGCLDTLMHLVGTPYGDVPGFVRTAGDDGCILFLENSGLRPSAFVRALTQLRYAGWFDGIRALVLGRSSGPDATSEDGLTYAEAVSQSLSSLRCSVLVDADFGHIPPQIMLIQGALGELRFSAGERALFTQTLA